MARDALLPSAWRNEMPEPAWVGAIEDAACMLDHAPIDDVRAASVSCQLCDPALESERLLALVCHLTDRRCLNAQLRIRDRSFTVQFTRADPVETERTAFGGVTIPNL